MTAPDRQPGPKTVVFEDTGVERNIVGRCGNCERTHFYVFDPKHMGTVVSPAGVMHVGAECGMTACGVDATGDEWWWATWKT